MKFAVLGDSIAYGQGASSTEDTIGARLALALTSAGTAAELQVFAAPRARSAALTGQVRRAVGWGAQVALIFVGANDLTHFVPTQQAVRQLGDAVKALRTAGTQVVVSPAPDLSVVPWVHRCSCGSRSGKRALRCAGPRPRRRSSTAPGWSTSAGPCRRSSPPPSACSPRTGSILPARATRSSPERCSRRSPLRVLGNKLTGILHGCLDHHQLYDETIARASQIAAAAA